jgi:hypothetical protein
MESESSLPWSQEPSILGISCQNFSERPQVATVEHGLQIWRITANDLSRQSRNSNVGWSPTWRIVGAGAHNASPLNNNVLHDVVQNVELGELLWTPKWTLVLAFCNGRSSFEVINWWMSLYKYYRIIMHKFNTSSKILFKTAEILYNSCNWNAHFNLVWAYDRHAVIPKIHVNKIVVFLSEWDNFPYIWQN